MVSSSNEWDQIYRKYPLEELAWELGKPSSLACSLAYLKWANSGTTPSVEGDGVARYFYTVLMKKKNDTPWDYGIVSRNSSISL